MLFCSFTECRLCLIYYLILKGKEIFSKIYTAFYFNIRNKEKFLLEIRITNMQRSKKFDGKKGKEMTKGA